MRLEYLPREKQDIWKTDLFANGTLVRIPRRPRNPLHLLVFLPGQRIIVETRIGGLGIRVLHARQSSRCGDQIGRVGRRRSCEFDLML